jgi:Tfp pilus assembly PilM family ATPase
MKNLIKNSRLTEQERRDLNSTLTETEKLERRRRPDRRLAGLDVRVIDVTETAFMNFIHQLILKK